MRKKTLLSWSSGKDSAWALYVLRQDPAVEVVGLFSVVNARFNRVSMHSTRAELLRRQAEAAGLPLYTINLPDVCTNEHYDAIMGGFVAESAADGTECIAFGDLFLEDVRQYREKRLKGTGIDPLFPLWGIPTVELAHRMLAAGLQAYISSVDLTRLPASFAGRQWSLDLLREFPPGVDPCGENGEMHTVVVDGPMFEKCIRVEVGEVVQRNGFAYADILQINHENGKLGHRAGPAILTGRCQD
ncbi:MAG: ATP-binding protein [bacterium]